MVWQILLDSVIFHPVPTRNTYINYIYIKVIAASIKVYILGTTSSSWQYKIHFQIALTMEELNDSTFDTFPPEFSSSQLPLSTQPPEIPNSQILHDSTVHLLH